MIYILNNELLVIFVIVLPLLKLIKSYHRNADSSLPLSIHFSLCFYLLNGQLSLP